MDADSEMPSTEPKRLYDYIDSSYLPESCQLKPKLESIFAEVQENLPTIDLEISDVSSDGEEPIIRKDFKIPEINFDEDKDLDTSLDEELWPCEVCSSSEEPVRKVRAPFLPLDNKQSVYCQFQQPSVSRCTPVNKNDDDVAQANHARPFCAKPNNEDHTSGGGMTLIQKLAQLSMDYSQEDLSNVDPMTGALRQSAENPQTSHYDEKAATVTRLGKEKDSQFLLKSEPIGSCEVVDIADLDHLEPISTKLTYTGGIFKMGTVQQGSFMELTDQPCHLFRLLGWPCHFRRVKIGLIGNILDAFDKITGLHEFSKTEMNKMSFLTVFSYQDQLTKELQDACSSHGMTLIQKLALLSMKYSEDDLTNVDPMTGVLRQPETSETNHIGVDLVTEVSGQPLKNHALYSNLCSETCSIQGGSLSSEEFTLVSRNLQSAHSVKNNKQPPQSSIEGDKNHGHKECLIGDERETVYLDLRDFKQKKLSEQQTIKRIQQILGIQTQRSHSSSDSEDDIESWQEERKLFKARLQSKGVSTATASLSIQTDSFEPSLNDCDYNDERAPQVQSKGVTANLPMPSTRFERLTPVELTIQKEAEKSQKIASQANSKLDDAVVYRAQEKATSHNFMDPVSQQKKMEAKRREKEKRSRQNIGKRLDGFKPSTCVSGQQACGDNTPTLFDIDISFEDSPFCLPTNLACNELDCVLLMVHLSASGEIIQQKSRGSGKAESDDATLSVSYIALLSWMLSLVPDFSGCTDSDINVPAPPFHVIGLQQLWLDNQLCLVVVVCPPPDFDANLINWRLKGHGDQEKSQFWQYTVHYLMTNSLTNVLPNVAETLSCEANNVQGASGRNSITKPSFLHVTKKPLLSLMEVFDKQAVEKIFSKNMGFFWQTLDSGEGIIEENLTETLVCGEIQNTMSLIYQTVFHYPQNTMGILSQVLQEGIDIVGIRLLYPSPRMLSLLSRNLVSLKQFQQQNNLDLLKYMGISNNTYPVLAIAFRGKYAQHLWIDLLGPTDPLLAQRTDPNSLSARFGKISQDWIFCPRNPDRVQLELVRWFGGRISQSSIKEVSLSYVCEDVQTLDFRGKNLKKMPTEQNLELDRTLIPPAALIARTKSAIFLIVSRLVFPTCLGVIVTECQKRGFQINGIKRMMLTQKKACVFGISLDVLNFFSPYPQEKQHLDFTYCRQKKHFEADCASMIILLQNENAFHHAASLVEALMVQLTLQGQIQTHLDSPPVCCHLFHVAPFTKNLQKATVGSFFKCPECSLYTQSGNPEPTIYTNPELEQVVVLLIRQPVLRNCGPLLGELLNFLPSDKKPDFFAQHDHFELLGIKWLPKLSQQQGKKVTPYEVGDQHWKESIKLLSSEPALVLMMRSVNAFKKLHSVISQKLAGENSLLREKQSLQLSMLMSCTAAEAYIFGKLFFLDKELFQDSLSRPLLPYVPEGRLLKEIESGCLHKENLCHTSVGSPIFDSMLEGPRPLTTVLIIKPAALNAHLPTILKKIAQEKFSIVGLVLRKLGENLAHQIISQNFEDIEKIAQHVRYLTSSECLCLCLQRENAIKHLLDLLGPTDPTTAREYNQFFWRGVFGIDFVQNGFHAPPCYCNAVIGQKLLFPNGLCCAETADLKRERITCACTDKEIDLRFAENRKVTIVNTQGRHISILVQVTCIVLTSALVSASYGTTKPAYLDVMEKLLAQGFELVGGRMLWFTVEQAESFLSLTSREHFQQVPGLICGPCIVLALQRDNAISRFEGLLRSYGEGSVLTSYGAHIFRPRDTKQKKDLPVLISSLREVMVKAFFINIRDSGSRS